MKPSHLLMAVTWLLTAFSSIGAAPILGQVFALDSPDQWVLAADAANVGKQQEWWSGPQPGAKPARVPGTIQETLGEYHGVAWYWRTAKLPRHSHPDGRFILRFWSIDYYFDVWVNGRLAGSHECADTRVEFDVTPTLRTRSDLARVDLGGEAPGR